MTSPRKKNPKYKRILLKLSGEALQGTDNYGINAKILTTISSEIKEIHHQGVEVSVVIGGGNIFRGISGASTGMDRSTADYMGMLATVINALALQDSLERVGVLTRIQTALEIKQVAESLERIDLRALGIEERLAKRQALLADIDCLHIDLTAYAAPLD